MKSKPRLKLDVKVVLKPSPDAERRLAGIVGLLLKEERKSNGI